MSRRSVPRRVLWITKGLGRGGAERLTVTCARHFDRARWTVDVAYVLPHKNAFVGDLHAAGIAVHCVGDHGPRLGWVRALRHLVRTGGYDLVHTHSPVPAVHVRMIPARQRPIVVHTEHNMWTRYHALTRVANAATFARNTGALAVSEGVAASMRRRSGAAAKVLHHGIDVDQTVHGATARAEARAALGVPPDAPVVGTVANFTPKKDHASLFDAVADLVTHVPEVVLVLIGSGPLEHALRQRARDLGLDRSVVFTGSRSDVVDLLPAFDVFALSSQYEGLAIALVEAMASGVAPVATSVGGVPEVITDGVDGLLVTPGRPGDLARGLRRLLEDDPLRGRLADAARRRAASFDIRHAVRAMEDWYEELLQ